ncbi:hypothetical protein [Streptomyces sp. YIM 98790]|uniref:hypothetical protein n=1 Tax=Streptomyces sp. YIM 98790 TaxID=2689077 RepID=UPI0014094489|nr:hypothetical protein [Streptomyces sp. YIM 98790]
MISRPGLPLYVFQMFGRDTPAMAGVRARARALGMRVRSSRLRSEWAATAGHGPITWPSAAALHAVSSAHLYEDFLDLYYSLLSDGEQLMQEGIAILYEAAYRTVEPHGPPRGRPHRHLQRHSQQGDNTHLTACRIW